MRMCILAAVVSCLLSNMSPYASAGSVIEELRVPISNGNILISPAGVKDQSSTFVLYQIYEGLVGFNERLEIVPQIAQSWIVSLDGLQYHFVINRTLQYSPGKHISGQHIASYYEWLIKIYPEKRWIFDQVEGVDEFISGKRKNISGINSGVDFISFTLSRPSHIFLINLASPLALVGVPNLDQSVFCGTGPYLFLSKNDNVITLERNPLNPRGQSAQVERVIFVTGVTSKMQKEIFKSGKIDLYQTIDLDNEKWARQSHYNTYEFQSYAMGLLVLNHGTLDLPIRRAICAAVDKADLANKSNLINARSTDSIVPSDFGKINADISCTHDGVSKRNFGKRLNFLTSEQYYLSSPAMFEELKAMLGRFGIHININIEPHNRYIAKLYKKDFDFAFVSYLGDYPDADAYYYPLLISQGEFNFMGFSDNIVDILLSVSREMLSANDRYSIYRRINEILSKNPVVVPLFSSVGMLVAKPHVQLEGINGRGIFSVDISRVRPYINPWYYVRARYAGK